MIINIKIIKYKIIFIYFILFIFFFFNFRNFAFPNPFIIIRIKDKMIIFIIYTAIVGVALLVISAIEIYNGANLFTGEPAALFS